jgi:hypothetical protein
MFGISQILSSKIFGGAVVAVTLLVMALWVQQNVIEGKNETIEEQKRDLKVLDATVEVKVFEANNSAMMQAQKEIKDEAIPGSVGTHTLSDDYWVQ